MRLIAIVPCLFLLGFATAARGEPQWLTLPPTPSLPTPVESGYAPVNGIRIWCATFGIGTPVILLHGGLANADYWGEPVPALALTTESSSWTAAATAAARATSVPTATT